MLRRRPRPPVPSWRPRLDEARAVIRAHGRGSVTDDRLDDLERALVDAEADREQLTAAIARLEPDRAQRELKAALRDADRRLGARDDQLVATLRRRYETVNQLQNRLEDLSRRIDTTVADLELLAARSIDLSVGRNADVGVLATELERLHEDLTALELAHEEIRHL